MPLPTPSAPVRKTPVQLAALTVLVLLAHVGLLYGTPLVQASHSAGSVEAFSTRMIAPPALPSAPVAVPPTVRTPPAHTVARPRVATPVTPTPAPATLRDDADPGPDTGAAPGATVEPVPPASDTAPVAVAQLLSADGPPANLKPAPAVAPVQLARADEPNEVPSTRSAPSSPSRASATRTASVFAYPPPAHLKYNINGEVKGFPYYVKGDLQWKQDGKTYEARMEVSHFLLGSRVQTSRGDLGPTGLEPVRFGDKTRSEKAAHFERSKGKIIFSANTPTALLVTGMQDQLSALLQLGAMLGGAPGNYPEGTAVAMETVGPESVESWLFKVGPLDKLKLPGGEVAAIKVVREAVGDYGNRAEVWLAPSMGYLPVRIRLSEPNGNYVDQKWSDTVAP